MTRQEFPLAPAVECSSRRGLSNFLTNAARKGAGVTVGYLVGSITAQPAWRVD